MSNQEPITVTNSGAGGFDVEIKYNGYQFDVLTSRESIRFVARDQIETEELLHVLEGVLDKLKTEVIIGKVQNRFQLPSSHTGDKPLDDP